MDHESQSTCRDPVSIKNKMRWINNATNNENFLVTHSCNKFLGVPKVQSVAYELLNSFGLHLIKNRKKLLER